jgi:hypothetical protein
MKYLRVGIAAAGFVALHFASILFAQSEKISLSVVPHAGQTVRYRMTQDLTMTITADADAEAPMPPMNVNAVTAITMSQAAGSADNDGRLPVILTYDEFLTEVKINGVATKVPDKNPLAGKQFTAIYAQDGTVVDVTGPTGTEAMVAPLKQMLTQLTAQLPKVKLAVGESATTPLVMPLPIPLPGAKGFELQGTTTMKLVSIEQEGAGRVASCDSTLKATLVNTPEAATPNPTNPVEVAMDIGMVGAGKLKIDIDRGVIRLNDSMTTVDGTIAAPGRDGKPGRMKLHGVTKITIAEAR